MGGLYLTSLTIERVRHLRNIVIPLSQDSRKALILTGENGSGKTSVLFALEDFLRNHVADVRGKFYGNMDEHGEKILRISVTCTSLEQMKKEYENGTFILASFNDTRKFMAEIPDHISKVMFPPYYAMSDNPSLKFVSYLVNLKATQAFAAAKNDTGRAEEIELWFRRFEEILRQLYEDKSLTLDFNVDTFEFTIHTSNREPFDFNTMAMGYSAVFKIIGDLMMRMEANAKGRYDLEGIVLIDEIETHLHVELQKKIVPILMGLFPNIQFVLTTHSPFVLNSAKNSVVYDLEKRLLAADGLTNLPYDGIVEGYFGADLLSQELEEKFRQYVSLTQKRDLSDADYVKIEELEMYLDEVPDYLAVKWKAEYNRRKLDFSVRG